MEIIVSLCVILGAVWLAILFAAGERPVPYDKDRIGRGQNGGWGGLC